MTFTLHGINASPGIVIGKAHIVNNTYLNIRKYPIKKNHIKKEQLRLKEAVNQAKKQLQDIRDRVLSHHQKNITDFIDAHLLMLSDQAFYREPGHIIERELCNAEWAVKLNCDGLIAMFEKMDDAYLRTRCDDVTHVANQILRSLLNQSQPLHTQSDSYLRGRIILADDLSPSDTILMQHHKIAAFATEHGTLTSHAAILAKSMGIPAVVGLHNAHRYIRDNEQIILDGAQGIILVEPENRVLNYYRKYRQKERRYTSSLARLKRTHTITQDGTRIKLMANIELPSDFNVVRDIRAEGIGLYRTEFLYRNRESPADEEEHFTVYAEAIKKLDGLPLTIRTLDWHSQDNTDTGTEYETNPSNPALGLRAIRLCLRKPALLQSQLRAIIRASALGPVRLMIPFLSNTTEVRQVLEMINNIKQQFDQASIDYDQQLPIGGMIEVPAAAICADNFAQVLDFLSIGTNDLIQYTMAIDRVNDEVSYLYDPLHPAVLRLIKTTIDAGKKANIPVSMCGEMASEKQYTRLLLALGLSEFSVQPTNLLEIRKAIIETNLDTLSSLADKTLALENSMQINALLAKHTL